MDSRARSVVHFTLAYGAALLVGAFGWMEFARNPPPRYGDLLLPGVALLSAKRSWKAGVCLLAVSLAIMLAVVWPLTIRKLLGFGILAGTGSMIVWVVELAKRSRSQPPDVQKR